MGNARTKRNAEKLSVCTVGITTTSGMPLDCVVSRFAGPNSHCVAKIVNEDLAIADLACLGCFDDRVHDTIRRAIGDNDLKFDFGDEVDRVLRTTIGLRLAFLTSETTDLRYGHAMETRFRQALLYLVQHMVA